MPNTKKNGYALVTGATNGIGYELAKLLAQDGYNLVIAARHEDELNKIANDFEKDYNVDIIPIAKDLFEPNAAFELYAEVKAKGLDIDILINDAGQGQHGMFTETDIHRELDIIQLNIVSLVVLTKLCLKDMVARKKGKVLQLASVVSVNPSPLMAVYAATKAFVLSFTEALINELKDTNVTMTALLPGATDTDFFNKADAENTKIVQEGKLADPADVAKEGYKAMMNGDRKVVAGFSNKVMAAMSNVMPDAVLAENMRKDMEEVPRKK